MEDLFAQERMQNSCRNLQQMADMPAWDCNLLLRNLTKIFNPSDDPVAPPRGNRCGSATCKAFYGVALPIVCSISLLACTFTLRVLLKMHRSSINVCFMGLFSTETLKVICSALTFIPFAYCDDFILCRVQRTGLLVLYPLALWCHMLSTCICMIITADRYLVISQPFRACYFTKRRTVFMLIIAAGLAFIFILPTAFELRLTDRWFVEKTWLRDSNIYAIIYYLCIRCLVGFIGFFIVLFVLNCLLLRDLLKTHKLQLTEGRQEKSRNQNSAVTSGCVGVVFGFVFTNLLPGISDILEASKLSFPIMIYLGNTFIAFGPLLNAAIYCGVGAKFRHALTHGAPKRSQSQSQTSTVRHRISSKVESIRLLATRKSRDGPESPLELPGIPAECPQRRDKRLAINNSPLVSAPCNTAIVNGNIHVGITV